MKRSRSWRLIAKDKSIELWRFTNPLNNKIRYYIAVDGVPCEDNYTDLRKARADYDRIRGAEL